MLDVVKGYLQLVEGLTESAVRKAKDTAGSLVSGTDGIRDVPGRDAASAATKAAASSVQGLADDLVEQGKANSELIVGLVRTEVDRAAGRLGFIREEELAAVRRHVARLESQVTELRSEVAASRATATSAAAAAEPVVDVRPAEGGSPSAAARAAGAPKRKIPVTKPAAPGSDS